MPSNVIANALIEILIDIAIGMINGRENDEGNQFYSGEDCNEEVKKCEEGLGQPCVCGALIQCTSAIEESETVHMIKYINGEAVKIAEIEQLNEYDIMREKSFSGCKFSSDKQCVLAYEDGVIEGDVWQDIDTGLKQRPTGGTVNVNNSYMICNYGPGVIYFKDSGQDFRTAMYREVVSQNFKYKYDWAKEGTVTPEFMERAAVISFELGIDPDDLMAVMAFESRFNPKAKNAYGAYGLIQFTQISLDEINRNNGTSYSKSDLENMDAMEQLELVYLHYKPLTGKMHDIGDVYIVTLAPSFVDNDDNVLYSQQDSPQNYIANKGLDKNSDGKITKDEAVERVLKRREEFRYEEY